MKFSAAALAVILPFLVAQAQAQAKASDTSLTIDPSVLAKGFENNGQAVKEAGQVPSLTSSNNFINFCVGKGQITNGLQVTGGSCNPAPMGQIPSTDNMPSGKFVFPVNMQNIAQFTPFTIKVKMSNIQMGSFTNAQQNYYAAPQQLNGKGQIIGHTHVVVEQIPGMQSTEPTNPKVFAFFKGINTPADGQGIVSADVTKGLGPGVYRVATITAAMNHQPALVAVAQHGSIDDMVYFSVGADGAKQAAATIGQPGAAAPAPAAAPKPAAQPAAAPKAAAPAPKAAAPAPKAAAPAPKVAAVNAGGAPAPGQPGAAPRPGQPGAAPRPGQPGAADQRNKAQGGRQGKGKRFIREAY